MKLATIARGNTKVGAVPNVSLPPVTACANCSHCRTTCYALKAYRQYEDTRNAWDSNLLNAIRFPADYFAGIEAHCLTHGTKLFRYHVSGDILTQGYLDGMRGVALRCPGTRFLAFTKRFDLDFSNLPGNLAIVLSVWPGMPLPANDNGLPLAWVQDGTETRIPSNAIECPGQCDTCGKCWNLPRLGKDVFFHIH